MTGRGGRGRGGTSRGGAGSSAKSSKSKPNLETIRRNINKETHCFECCDPFEDEDESLQCDGCTVHIHRVCAGVDPNDYEILSRGNPNIVFNCTHCLKKKGDENKRVESLESKFSSMLDAITDLKANLITQLDKTIDDKLNERLKGVEENVAMQVRQEVSEMTERERRRLNVIIQNVPESTKEEKEEKQKDDAARVLEMFKNVEDVKQEEISDPVRLPSKSDDRPRVIKVSFKSETTKQKILRNYFQTLNKKGTNPKECIYINNDLTPIQRKEEKTLRDDLKRRREAGEANLVIRNGKIITKNPNTREGPNHPGSPSAGRR